MLSMDYVNVPRLLYELSVAKIKKLRNQTGNREPGSVNREPVGTGTGMNRNRSEPEPVFGS